MITMIYISKYRYYKLPVPFVSALPHGTHFPPWKRQWLGSARTTSTKTL